jgi:hypothetical protein
MVAVRCVPVPVSREPHSGRVTSLSKQALGLLVSVSSTHYCASTSDLSPSDLLGALPGYPVGAIILERASRLDAFSGYHFRT